VVSQLQLSPRESPLLKRHAQLIEIVCPSAPREGTAPNQIRLDSTGCSKPRCRFAQDAEEVGGLQIAVDDADAVGVGYCVARLQNELDSLLDRQRPRC
jgi:hypothetical protein